MAEKRIKLRALVIQIDSDGGDLGRALERASRIATEAIVKGQNTDTKEEWSNARIAVKVQHGA